MLVTVVIDGVEVPEDGSEGIDHVATLLTAIARGDQNAFAQLYDMLSPRDLSRMLNNSCGARPTVVVVSACFSGVFIPEIAGPNRFVLTAARADRTSFGCGQADRYTFFDECFLSSIAAAHDFRDLAIDSRRCVAAREKKENVSPPSDPQAAIGDNAASFPQW